MKCFLHDNMKYYIPLYRNYWKTRKLNYVFIEFNAWEYSGTDVLVAGLVKCMYDTLEQEFGQTFLDYIYTGLNQKSLLSQIVFILYVIYFLGLGILFLLSIPRLSNIINIYFIRFVITLVTLFPKLKDLFNNIIKGQSKLLEAQVKQINSKVGFMQLLEKI